MPTIHRPTKHPNNQSEADAESVPSSLRIVCDDASSINLQAAEPTTEGKPALRKFSMVAYTGGAMRLGGWPYPVVVDLAGMKVTRKSRPILKDHDRSSIVGHTNDIAVNDSRLEVAGVISGVGMPAQEVIATSENGFPWQASLERMPTRLSLSLKVEPLMQTDVSSQGHVHRTQINARRSFIRRSWCRR